MPFGTMANGFVGRIRAIIGSLYSIFPLGGNPGGAVFRNAAGSVVLTISTNSAGGLVFTIPDSTTMHVAGGGNGSKVYLISQVGTFLVGALSCNLAANKSLGWTAANGNADLSTDSQFSRLAAGVIGTTHTLQQTGLRSAITANVTNATITLATTGLGLTLKAGRKYAGRVKLWLENVTAADGIKLDLDGGTATWTSFRATYVAYDTSGPAPIASGTVTAPGTAFNVATFTGAGWVEIEWSGVVNAAGTLIPQFAKNTDASGATLSLRANSFHQAEDYP